ncbi:MAG: hypothetical protein ACYS9V_03295 [Planctomycetota bacterium]|jgi:hypothetical protein
MRKWLFLVLIFQISPLLLAEVTVEVREPDGITPYDCNEGVMVGAKLPIVVISDNNDFWSGGLFIEDQNRAYGFLEGRDYDPNRLLYDPNRSSYGINQVIENWGGSHLPKAGESARVTDWEDSLIQGFDLYTTEINDNNFIPGEWFVTDYDASETGDCNLGFYDYTLSWTEPQKYIELTNVPTRNFNKDPNQDVDFLDYAFFTSRWGSTDCVEPNWCEGADLDRNGDVNQNDLALFIDYWLWFAPNQNTNKNIEPNQPAYPADPNIIYRIVDVNGANEITIGVNESIRLYIDLSTIGDSNMSSFYIEADISNISLGYIDNIEFPSGTAMIHAGPNRDMLWDYWGPGLEQQEGIRFLATTSGNPIDDGHLASFVYTALGESEIELSLINWDSRNTYNESIYPALESIKYYYKPDRSSSATNDEQCKYNE